MSWPRQQLAPAGMTLFELVTVLAIVVILAGIAMPRFSSADQRHRADAAAQRIAADLHYAGRTARARAASVGVSFSLETDTYTAAVRALDAGPDEPYVVHLDRPPYRVRLVDVDFAGGTTVTFDGYGRPTESGQVTVEVGQNQRRIVIDSTDGAIRLE